ncbi:MAG: CD225/dispanin family protein [Muribaculaceae bacterium]|nr:CD225/dispanin family protein [Muribaculaceae bacterium]
MKKIAIFASGSGTNAENIYKFFANGNRVSVPLVIYDRSGAGVAERMAKYPGVETLHIPGRVWKEHPEEILDLLKKEDIDLVVLAGFLRFVPNLLTEAYSGRMLNIHPSLLPAYGGAGMYGDKVHEAVIAAGERRSGVTVHYVSDRMDEGEILMQEEVEVTPEDTPESLAHKIHQIEYSLYPRAIVAALSGMREENPPVIKGVTPPPMPTPAEEWAETLGVEYDPEKVAIQEGPAAGDTELVGGAGSGEEYPGATGGFGGHDYSAEKGKEEEKMPPTYLVWAVVMTVLCCLPAGIAAIVFACQVSNRFYAGDVEGARRASRNAEIWIIVSFVLGVMANTLYLPLMLLF